MIKDLSTSDLKKLVGAIKSHFGQFFMHGEQVSGENNEENKRLLKMYGEIADDLHQKFQGKALITEDFVRENLEQEINNRNNPL